jgi:hypothetical protein
MYIANKTFTSKHNHSYQKGQRITNARYYFLANEDKPSFDYHVHGSYEPHQEEDANYGHPESEYYYPATNIDSGVVVGILAEELVQAIVNPDPVVISDPTPIAFGEGSGGGAGATDSWTPDTTSTPDVSAAAVPVFETPAPEPVVDNTPDPTPDPEPDPTPDTSDSSSDSSDNS